MKKTIKEMRKDAVNHWVSSFSESIPSSHHLYTLEERGVNLEAELDKMTAKQLRMISHLMAAAYNKAYDDARKWKREAKERNEAWEKTKAVSGGKS